MSNINPATETPIDLKQLSLHILRQLDEHSGNDKVWLDVWNDKVPKPELNLNDNEIARWKDWKWAVYSVLRENGLLRRLNKTFFYRSVISDEGKKFLRKNEQEQGNELDKMWQEYDEETKRFTSPKTKDEYVQAIRQWIDTPRPGKNDIRKYRNCNRCLAEYYFSDKPLSGGNLQKIVNTRQTISTLVSFGRHIARNFGFAERKAYLFEPHLFLERVSEQGEKLIPAFRDALRETIGEDGLKEWQKFSFETPNKSEPPIQEEDEVIAAVKSDIPLTGILKDIDEILRYKKQVILYGAPGTGKTYGANEYLKAVFQRGENEGVFDIGKDDWDESYVRRCTFHPEYGYEHFIEGLRPDPAENAGLRFELRPGVFKELCSEARKDENSDINFYLIIDEINRGDIPRIFGELITLIEADKRGWSKRTKLPLSGDDFWVPPNVYIIATMNTADRSIALLDTALRRRFGFLEIKPDSSVFETIGLRYNVPKSGKSLGSWFDGLNGELKIALEKSRPDVEHILIGHSFFLQLKGIDNPEDKETRFRQIIQNEILPLIQEYCYEDKDAFNKLVDFVKNTTGIMPIGQSAEDQSENTEILEESSNE